MQQLASFERFVYHFLLKNHHFQNGQCAGHFLSIHLVVKGVKKCINVIAETVNGSICQV